MISEGVELDQPAWVELLTPTQCVMDRQAAYFYWNDLQSLDQALMVASSQEISLARVDAWAKREEASEKLRKFKQELATRKPTSIKPLS